MNKKFLTSEIIGGPGLSVMSHESTSQLWMNSETVDVVKTTTNIVLDPSFLMTQINMHLTSFGPKMVEDSLNKLIKEKIHFDMVSWINEDGIPEVTCQLFYGDKLIDEKTTHIIDGKKEIVASPV